MNTEQNSFRAPLSTSVNNDCFQQPLNLNREKCLIEALSLIKRKEKNIEVGSGDLKKKTPPTTNSPSISLLLCLLGQEKLQIEHWKEKEDGGK